MHNLFIWLQRKSGRILLIVIAAGVYLALLLTDGLRFLPGNHDMISLLLYGFSAVVAALFLAVGSLVWLYARSSQVALALFGFTTTMMLTFVVETGAVINDPPLTRIANSVSTWALFLFFLLLLLFPRNILFPHPQMGGRVHAVAQLRCYTAGLGLLSLFFGLHDTVILRDSLPPDSWFNISSNIFVILQLVSILVAMIASYRGVISLRERQQMRILLLGVILSVMPLLVLTVTPETLLIPGIDGQWSTLTFVFLPLALGYSILRYQILVVDRYINSVVTWIVNIVCVSTLTFLVWNLSNLLFARFFSLSMAIFIGIMSVSAPLLIWWLTRLIHRLFLPVQHLLYADQAFVSLDLTNLAASLELAAEAACGATICCLFVRENTQALFRLVLPSRDQERDANARQALAHALTSALEPGASVLAEQFEVGIPLLEHCLSKRPHVLEELPTAHNREQPVRLRRFFSTLQRSSRVNPLVAGAWQQGQMIGVALFGARVQGADPPSYDYAGPDFEVAQLLLARFALPLQLALREVQDKRRRQAFQTLLALWEEPLQIDTHLQALASRWAHILAHAIEASNELWWYDEQKEQLYQYITSGPGPFLQTTGIRVSSAEEWSNVFYTPQGEALPWHAYPPLLQPPSHAFAWLPLQTENAHYGVLVLNYAYAHQFTENEQQLLSAVAQRCATALLSLHSLQKMNAQLSALLEQQQAATQNLREVTSSLPPDITRLRDRLSTLERNNDPTPPLAEAQQAPGQQTLRALVSALEATLAQFLPEIGRAHV